MSRGIISRKNDCDIDFSDNGRLALSFTFYSVLDKDFQELKSKFGYDYIELQLDFSMDLYPFFPPLVKVSRLTNFLYC